MSRLFKKLHLFLASPGDLGEERGRVMRVAERINRSGGPADSAGVIVEVLRWETHIAPLMGRPEDVVLEQLPVESWDLFVGVLWKRFGSPTGAAEQDFGRQIQSGTEEEFELAYRLWKERRRPQILFYRCIRPPKELTEIDPQQLQRVQEFFGRFAPLGKNPGLFRTFNSPDDFEGQFEQDLSRILKTIRPPAGAQSLAPPQSANHIAPSLPAKHRSELRPGEAYQVAFLSIDIAKHSRLVKHYRDRAPEVQILLNKFQAFVGETAGQHQGEIFSWAGDGGILVFWGEAHQARCALAGLHLLQDLVLFNLTKEFNPLDHPIAVRMAANEALILFQIPTSAISSDDLNLTIKLQEQATNPGELCITDTLRAGLDDRLAGRFSPKGRFDGKPVFSFRQPLDRDRPDADALNVQVDRVRDARKLLLSALEKLERAEDDGQGLSVALDGFYSEIEEFCTRFESFDDRWSNEYLTGLRTATERLIQAEADVWQQLRASYRDRIPSDTDIEALIQVASSRRAHPVVFLEVLRSRATRSAKAPPSIEGVVQPSGLMAKITGFLHADELDQETALTDLLMNHRGELADLITNTPALPGEGPLLNRLWQHADLVLQDDLFSLHGERRKDSPEISALLSKSPVFDPRFAALRGLLQQERVQDQELRPEMLWAVGEGASDQDREVICKCLLIGHPDGDTQQSCAYTLSLGSVWQMIARSRLPLEPLNRIGLRVSRRESVEHQKIFFDCVRSRLEEECQAATTREKIAFLTKIIMILIQCEYMIESMYFERFDALLTSFMGAVERLGLQGNYFQRLRTKLETEREKKGQPKGTLPQGLRRLPLPLQKRLAGEPHYLFWFVAHPDARIALETERHIDLNNIARVLKIPEINQDLMVSLLRKRELFGHPTVIAAALSNPKCSVDFARQNLPRLGRSPEGQRKLSAIAQSPSGNAEVRALARSLLAGESARSGAKGAGGRRADRV